MLQIIQLQGTDPQLYPLVGPLVMNPKVLKQNYNFPFRTNAHFLWFIATEAGEVLGFMPVEQKKSERVINNYYVKDRNPEILKSLIQKVLESPSDELPLSAVSFIEDKEIFQEEGFSEEKLWTRYVKMKKETNNHETGKECI